MSFIRKKIKMKLTGFKANTISDPFGMVKAEWYSRIRAQFLKYQPVNETLYRKWGCESGTMIVKVEPFQEPSVSITQNPEKYPAFVNFSSEGYLCTLIVYAWSCKVGFSKCPNKWCKTLWI
jgi:hypothetical protein